ncbi:hypothetical protein BTO30_13435 [Domibacillus antri]|uniref:Major virion structural protein n=1 Tax=Domibacillus antri TaxID=1714264 RepID=A0A1Q8Q2Y1_9BACI|nr:hypothetical protein [Domibacillus antri]OLN21700.1 hypothetical protein BTO30_13435 [Domibacillus antri]
MPYISSMFTEQTLQTDFVALAVANGWLEVARFKKVTYVFTDIFYGTNSIPEPSTLPLELKIADHALLKNSRGDIYAIARICEPELTWGDIPAEFKTGELPNQEQLGTDSVLRESLHAWMHDQWNEQLVDTSKIYFYMLNSAPTIPVSNEVVFPTSAASIRDVLDIELLGYEPKLIEGGTSYEIIRTDVQHLIMQSPMTPVSTRNIGTSDNGWMTNWWPDSKLKVEGFIDGEVLSLLIRADNTAAYDDNQVPMIPVYFGPLVPLDPADTDHASLFAGSAVGLPTYQYDSTTPFIADTAILLPTEKQYPQNPGNGIDNIIVKRSKLGAYYQAYSLSVSTGPEQMPPDRKDDAGRQFPSAWRNEANDEYTYPATSSYTNKATVSRAWVVHPEERERGYLKHMIVASSVGPRNGVRLKLKKAACPDVFEYYKYIVVDAVSPLTKRPSVPYRPMGFGIFEREGV